MAINDDQLFNELQREQILVWIYSFKLYIILDSCTNFFC